MLGDELDRAIAEENRRHAGDFDGLLGSLEGVSAQLIKDLWHDLVDYVLDRHSDDDVRQFLNDYHPANQVEFGHHQPVDEDVRLALGLMIKILSALDPANFESAENRDRVLFGDAVVGLFRGRRSGGQKGADRQRRMSWNQWKRQCLRDAQLLLANGRARHELAGILAKKYRRNPTTVRRFLADHLPK